MSRQIAVRLPDALDGHLAELVAEGRFESKADAVRRAVEALVDREQRRAVGEAIAGGYRRVPQTDEEVEMARAAASRSIHEEPW